MIFEETMPINEAPKQTNGKFSVKYVDNNLGNNSTNMPTKTPTIEDDLTGLCWYFICKIKVTTADAPPTISNIKYSISI